VGLPQRLAHDGGVSHVALDEVEARVRAEVVQALAGAVGDVVQRGDAGPGGEQVLAEDAADVAEPAGDEDAFAHATPFPGVDRAAAIRGGRESTPGGQGGSRPS